MSINAIHLIRTDNTATDYKRIRMYQRGEWTASHTINFPRTHQPNILLISG